MGSPKLVLCIRVDVQNYVHTKNHAFYVERITPASWRRLPIVLSNMLLAIACQSRGDGHHQKRFEPVNHITFVY